MRFFQPWTGDLIGPFLQPYMGVVLNSNMAFIFPILGILALIFPILIKYVPKCEEKGSFLKSQIKSLTGYTEPQNRKEPHKSFCSEYEVSYCAYGQ